MTEENVAERMKCRCGLPMLVNAGGARYCENCDGVQDQEGVFARRKTKEDIRFDMYWLRVMKTEYKDNRTVKTAYESDPEDVKTSPPDEQEEVPPNE